VSSAWSGASDWKATQRPSAEIDGRTLSPIPCLPSLVTLTRVVVPASRSRTNTSRARLVSVDLPSMPGFSRLVAADSKATILPSPLMTGRAHSPLACTSLGPTSTRIVSWVWRSVTKQSVTRLVSPSTRLSAADQ